MKILGKAIADIRCGSTVNVVIGDDGTITLAPLVVKSSKKKSKKSCKNCKIRKDCWAINSGIEVSQEQVEKYWHALLLPVVLDKLLLMITKFIQYIYLKMNVV